MDKAIVKQSIIVQQEETVAMLKKGVAEVLETTDVDEQEGQGRENYVHQQVTTNPMRRIKTQLQIAEGNLATIQTLPLDSCNAAKKGALIEMDYLNFYLGISSLPFQIEGKK